MDFTIERKKVLIIDDNQDLVDAITLYFEDAGLEGISTIDPLKVEEILENNIISAVVSDLKMPKRSGIECLEIIRKRYGDSMPVILITGFASMNRDLALKHGFNELIEKPFNPKTLIKILDKEMHKYKIISERKNTLLLSGEIYSKNGEKTDIPFTIVEFENNEMWIETKVNTLKNGEKERTFLLKLTVGEKVKEIIFKGDVIEALEEEGEFQTFIISLDAGKQKIFNKIKELYQKKQERLMGLLNNLKGVG